MIRRHGDKLVNAADVGWLGGAWWYLLTLRLSYCEYMRDNHVQGETEGERKRDS